MLGLLQVGTPANGIVPGPRLYGGGPVPPKLPPGGGGGGFGGGGLPIGPLVPALGRSGVGLGLLGAYAIGFGIGLLINEWLKYNWRNTYPQPGPPPGSDYIQNAEGEYTPGARNYYEVPQFQFEGYDFNTNTWRLYYTSMSRRRTDSILQEMPTIQARDWQDRGNGLAGYQTYGVMGADGGWWDFFNGGGLKRPSSAARLIATPWDPLNTAPAPGNPELPPLLDPFWRPEPPLPFPPAPVLPEPEAPPDTKPREPMLPPPVEWAPPGIEVDTGKDPKPQPPLAPPTPAPAPPITQPKPGRPPIVIRPDGTPAPEPKPPPTTRPPGTEDVPGGEIGQPGTQPRPDLVGIAAELGKIEQKCRKLLERQASDESLEALLEKLAEILAGMDEPYPAGSYALFPVCETDGNGEPRPPMVTEWPAGAGTANLLNQKLDALAELVQFHKELRQPVCNRAPFGEEVTVNFREDPETATGATLLRKVLRYRDRTGASVASHAAHWEGFEWNAGPVIVSCVGPWGEVQVWASSRAEGQRVIRHALAAGGWNPDTDPAAEWLDTTAPAGRAGRSGRMLVAVDLQGLRVTKRRGSSGPPEQVLPE